MYCIGTGSLYIAARPDNSLYATEKLDEARLYSTSQRASNALVTLPRRFYEISSKWAVREMLNSPEPDNTSSPVSIHKNTEQEKKSDMANEHSIDFLEIFNSVANLKDYKSGCLTKLNGELSRLTEEITDIEHYIEFSKLNVSDAYRAYKMLRDTLQERRQIKDSITAAKTLYDNCNIDKVAEVQSQLEHRKYKPRRLEGLFE